MNDTFAAALAAAGWTVERHWAFVDAHVATAPPLPAQVVELLRTPRLTPPPPREAQVRPAAPRSAGRFQQIASPTWRAGPGAMDAPPGNTPDVPRP